MSMNGASVDLANGLKKLRLRWEEAREGWQDGVAREFEEQHWSPLEAQVEAVLQAMARLTPILTQVRRECS